MQYTGVIRKVRHTGRLDLLERLARNTEAKVGDHLVRLDYELKNGDIVELITSRARKGPSPEWLSKSKDEEGKSYFIYARTRQARSKIRHWLNRQKQNEEQKAKAHK